MSDQASFYCYGKKITPPQTSIHPRVYKAPGAQFGRTVHPKVNTAKAKKTKG